MPEMIDVDGVKMEIATEAELLAFANKVREAGGADVLNALLPSRPGRATKCLIARALNFECSVFGWTPVDDRNNTEWASGDSKWIMLPHRGSPEQCDELARELSKKLKLRLVRNEASPTRRDQGWDYALLLPKHIGNAAAAFDSRVAFTHLIETRYPVI